MGVSVQGCFLEFGRDGGFCSGLLSTVWEGWVFPFRSYVMIQVMEGARMTTSQSVSECSHFASGHWGRARLRFCFLLNRTNLRLWCSGL
jgi:hypothetical protein